MSEKKSLPYGTWLSSISPDWIGNLREFSELSWGAGGRLFWVERHSKHSSLMVWDPNTDETCCLSGDINVGGGLIYGGGSYHVSGDRVVFIDKTSNQLKLIDGFGSEPQLIATSPYPKASPRLSPIGSNLVYIISDGERDSIKITDYKLTSDASFLSSSFGFYNFLRWHPDGKHLAWISWDHPHMPWENAWLNLAELRSEDRQISSLENIHKFFDQTGYSLLQPEFSANGRLMAYLSNQNGWWNIFVYNLISRDITELTAAEADHSLAPWVQNQTSYGFSPDNQRIYCIRYQLGFASLWQLDLSSNTEDCISLDDDYTWLESLAVSKDYDLIALVASGGRKPSEIIITSPRGEIKVIRKAADLDTDPVIFSMPTAITWKVKNSPQIHGLFYEPKNPGYESEGKPPLLIIVHGGPTHQKYAEFQARTQYFTSRGFAVLEVNYRGSTGYGKEYWQALKGQWGVLDVEDIYQAANILSEKDLFDSERIALLGSSAGGFSVLRLLIKHPGVFKAGISLYGITNLLELFKDPPKYERFYNHWLIGDPDTDEAVYKSRSPLFSANKIRDPIAIFQGGKDPIVPQDQAEEIVKTLKSNKTPFEYYLYPEEGHGFKKSENVSDFYNKSEAFLTKHLINDQHK